MARCHLAVAESNAACTAAENDGPTFWIVMLKVDACPVAENVTGLPPMPAPVTVAVRLFAPGGVPSTQLPTWATPFAFVVALAAVTLPPPDVTANVTVWPD